MFNKDFGKDAFDFLTKGIPKDKKIEATTFLTKNDIKVVFTGKTASDDSAIGIIAPTFKYQGAEVKAEIHTGGEHKVIASVSDKGLKGLKLQGDFALGATQNLSISSDYRLSNNKTTLSGKLTFPFVTSATLVEGAFAHRVNNVAYGVSVAAALAPDFKVDVDKVTGSVEYAGPTYRATLQLSRAAARHIAEFRFYQRVGLNKFASEFTYNHSSNTAGAAFGVEFPVSHTVAQATTATPIPNVVAVNIPNALVKTTIGTSGVVGVAYKRIIDAHLDTENSSITLGAHYNYPKQSASFGLNVNIAL